MPLRPLVAMSRLKLNWFLLTATLWSCRRFKPLLLPCRAGKSATNGQVQQATFNYNNFQDADKKFLDNYRKLERSSAGFQDSRERFPDKSPDASKAGGSVLGQ